MKAYDLGSNYAVTVSAFEVGEWNRRWPCSEVRGRQRFEFEKKTGDLVDRAGRGDGPAALALSHDAQAYGKARLKLAA